MVEWREICGRTEDEPLPDLSVFPPEIMEYTSPLGTYFDAFPLHLLTTATLAELRTHNRQARFESRRFRPNLVLDSGSLARFAEHQWHGRVLRLRSARV